MPTNEYMKTYMANRRKTRRQKLFDLSGSECVDCGSPDDLELNHKDPTTKSFTLSGAGLDRSWKSILEELDKCEVVCKTCHDEKTKQQWRDGAITPWNKGIRGEYYHGTARMYHEMTCRCDRCKTAKRLYRTGLYSGSDIIA